MRLFRTRGARLAAAGALALAVYACDSDRLVVPDYNNPSSGPIASDPRTAIQLLGTGVLRTERDLAATFILGTGILGREAYNYTGTEGRNTTGWLTNSVLESSSFGGVSNWTGFYQNLRQIKTLRGVIESAADASLPADQRAAARGFAQTMEGLTLHYLIQTRNNIGIPIEVSEDPAVLAPFVSRDEAYAAIVARLDSGAASLAEAGSTNIPFTMHSGFAGFTSAANFRKFNRGLAARVNAYRASLGIGSCAGGGRAACYSEVLENLAESFIDPAGSLATGVYRVYSTASGDVQNGIRVQLASIRAHARTDSGVQVKANGDRDDRFTAKIVQSASEVAAQPAGIGAATRNDFRLYPDGSAPIPLMKNEELVLLRAEARYFTGDVAGALADINTIRTRSGGLAPLAGFASETAFVDELLYNRRFSLLFEGHRWIDMRRFGRLNQLTRDLPTHITIEQLPVPQAECLARARATGAAAAPANSGCASA